MATPLTSGNLSGGPKRCGSILVIEDDQDIRDSLQQVLEAEEYQVHVAANGREGLEKLAEIHPPCLVLLDLMMPVMNGAEFLEILRQDEALSAIPVIIVSAWPKAAERTRGSQGFVEKPVDLERLLKVVARYC